MNHVKLTALDAELIDTMLGSVPNIDIKLRVHLNVAPGEDWIKSFEEIKQNNHEYNRFKFTADAQWMDFKYSHDLMADQVMGDLKRCIQSANTHFASMQSVKAEIDSIAKDRLYNFQGIYNSSYNS